LYFETCVFRNESNRRLIRAGFQNNENCAGHSSNESIDISPEAVSACAVSPWTIFLLLLISGGGDPESMVVSSSLDTRLPAKEAFFAAQKLFL
jgi:hypothetical protein